MPITLISSAFALLLSAAAVTDFLRQRIPNLLVLALVVLFALQAVRHTQEISWLNQLGAGAICLFLGFVLFTLNQIGAGDAKLLAAVALWPGLFALVPTLFLISLAGVAFAAVLVGVRRLIVWRNWDSEARLPKSLHPGGGIPYGVAIAIGALLSVRFFPAWLWN